jgi:very-short-patch-repair endonuclease
MYNDKIESPAEDWFYHEIKKRIDGKIEQQEIVNTGKKKYRVDFLLTGYDGMPVVAVEIDGKKYHNELSDSKRDKEIIKNVDWDCIVRFQAHDLVYNAPLATISLCQISPMLFGDFDKMFKAMDDARAYLITLGVPKISFNGVSTRNGYSLMNYTVYWMNHELQDQYFKECDAAMLVGELIEPDKFCIQKHTSVKVMWNDKLMVNI